MAGEGVAQATREAEAVKRSPSPGTGRSFVVWGVASYMVLVAGTLLVTLHRTGGRLIYVIDDPAIHLSVARNLAEHGTWGVVPGHFQSASSSPLWTVLLAAWIKILPGPDSVAPLLLNLAAGLVVIVVLGMNQRVLRPGRDRPLDVAAVAAIVSVLLFLPGLAFTGMEHSLHLALVLPCVILFHRQATGRAGPGPSWWPYLLLAVATLVRFETAFVALGIAVALALTAGDARRGQDRWPVSLTRRPVLVVACSALPLAAFGLFNRLMAQGFLPNSVMAKSGVNREGGGSTVVGGMAGRVTADPLMAVLLAVFLVAFWLTWLSARIERSPSWTMPATVFTVAVSAHVALARVGWYERYQAYLVLLGIYALLCLLAEAPLPALRPSRASLLTPGIVGILLLFSWTKVALTAEIGHAVDDTYRQRYQAGLFFEAFYDRQPVATGELGYVSLLHHGPITDLFGLGDYEVLQDRRRFGQEPPRRYWSELARQRDFDIVAMYPSTLFLDTPRNWILVGTWHMGDDTVTAWEPDFQFWATRPDAVSSLQANLRRFEPRLPDGVELELNEFAELQAAEIDAPDRSRSPSAS